MNEIKEKVICFLKIISEIWKWTYLKDFLSLNIYKSNFTKKNCIIKNSQIIYSKVKYNKISKYKLKNIDYKQNKTKLLKK